MASWNDGYHPPGHLARVAVLFPLRHKGRASELRTVIDGIRRIETSALRRRSRRTPLT